MRKIDAFAHILPRSYLERLERQLEKTMAPSQLDYYRQGVFHFDPVLTDLDARWRKVEPYGDYAQVLVLAVRRWRRSSRRPSPPSSPGGPTTRWPSWSRGSRTAWSGSPPPCPSGTWTRRWRRWTGRS